MTKNPRFLKPVWQSVDAIFQDVSMVRTIIVNGKTVQCSKTYSGPTSVTILKVAPNMVDPTSLKHSVSSFKKSINKNNSILLHYRFTKGNKCKLSIIEDIL